MSKTEVKEFNINQKANLVFSILLVTLPLIVSLIGFLVSHILLMGVLYFWGFAYFLFFLISICVGCFKGQKFKLCLKFNFYSILILCMISVIFISSIVNTHFDQYFFLYFSLFLVFICISINNDNNLKNILLILLVTLGISCIMGFIDPFHKFMPGFNPAAYPLSLQFANPNYAGAVMATTSIYCYLKLHNPENKKSFIFYGILYTIFITYSFMNGSFAPISAIVLAEIFAIIYFSTKDKKVSFNLLIFSALSVAICFLVDLIPYIVEMRTCDYNYFLECVAVFDNTFNTNILSIFGIDNIKGADGWDRKELMIKSFKHCTSSVKNFLFGCGAGTYSDFRPHNVFLSLWLDFGIFMPLLYSAFWIGWFIKLLKLKYNENTTKLSVTIITFLLASLVSSFIFYSSYIMVIFLALFFRKREKSTILPNENKKL